MTQPYSLGAQTILAQFVHGREVVNTVGQVIIGAGSFDPSLVPSVGRAILWVVVIATSDITAAAEIELFNVTDGGVVAASQLTSALLSADEQSVTLAVPADLPDALKDYEVRLNINNQPGVEFVTCWKAMLKAQWS